MGDRRDQIIGLLSSGVIGCIAVVVLTVAG